MTWNMRTLGEICDEAGGEIRTGPFGSQLHRSDYSEHGTPVVMPQDLVDDRVSTANIARVAASHVERLAQHRLSPGDIVYGRRGDIGRHALITDREAGWLCGTGCLRISAGDGVIDPKYLHYYLSDPAVIEWIYNQAVGATMPNLNTSILRSIPIRYPALPAQRRIAGILSAYDDLIENNTRRIAILEEMAQAIYREWFVHFRFPGHEQVEMVESELGPIPAGWEVARLRDVIAVIESGSRPRSAKTDDPKGVVSIGAGNISGLGRYNYGKDPLVTRDFYDRLTKGRVKSGDVLLYKDGAQIGRKAMFRDGFPYEECCVNEHVLILRTNDRCSQEYLYFWLDQPDMTVRIINLNSNAAQPGITQDGVLGLPIVIPPREMINGFAAIADPLLRLLFNLAKRNRRLHQARDLLLPKLMSGEIDVEALESEPVGAVA